MLRENKFGDPIFLLQFFNVLCRNIDCAKFDLKDLDSTGNYQLKTVVHGIDSNQHQKTYTLQVSNMIFKNV